MGITHEWNGTVLTITSDSGTSSADLKGEKGDMGVRGAQGVKGNTGSVDTSLLELYATKEDLTVAIAEAQLPEKEVDLSAFYTKSETEEKVRDGVAAAANALKGNAMGAAVTIDDISPLAHELSVKVSSKNLLDERNGAGDIVFYNAQGVAQYRVGYMFPLPTGIYTISGAIKDGSSSDCNIYIGINDKDNKVRALNPFTFISNGVAKSMTFNIYDGDRFIIYCSKVATGKTEKESVDAFNIQVEVGTVATAYTPYGGNVEGAVVSQCSKNILDTSNGAYPVTYISSSGSVSNKVGYKFTVNAGTYTFSGKANTALTGAEYIYFAINDKDDVGVAVGNDAYFYIPTYTNGVMNTFTRTFNEGDKVIIYVASSTFGKTDAETMAMFDIQVELGDTATPYEPYTEVATAAVEADGTVNGLISHYPTTTLLVDKEGAQIECEYNRDLNKAYTELVQAIISLGGNI